LSDSIFPASGVFGGLASQRNYDPKILSARAVICKVFSQQIKEEEGVFRYFFLCSALLDCLPFSHIL